MSALQQNQPLENWSPSWHATRLFLILLEQEGVLKITLWVKMQGRQITPNQMGMCLSQGWPITFRGTGGENNEKELNSKVTKRLSTTHKFFQEIEYYSQKFISLWLNLIVLAWS